MELSSNDIATRITKIEPIPSAIDIIVKSMEAVENFSSMDGSEKTARVLEILDIVAEKMDIDVLRNKNFTLNVIQLVSDATKGNIAVNIRNITKAYVGTIADKILNISPLPQTIDMIAFAMQEVEKLGNMTGQEKKSYVVSIALVIAEKKGFSDESILRNPYILSQIIDTLVKTSKGKFIFKKVKGVFSKCLPFL